ADVVESGPRVVRGGRLVPAEVTADVDGPLGGGDGIDAVERPGHPLRLDVGAAGQRERHHRVVDRRPVAAGATGDDEVRVVRGDVGSEGTLDAADETEVVLPQP